ncbi:hypothetical protein OAC50_00990 [bacterium]|mgnify:FL=1|nr:hypothetical protein [bacterium]|tara:strand:+ start:233 stop:796 length:564 start_codon:yes stop_codon:yes gene_type:complete
MALFGGARDISLFRHVNRELMGDIITQQCAFYKYKIEETKVNLYGESAEEKYYMGPVLLNCLVERKDQEYPETDLGTDFSWGATFKFLRDDLLTAGEDFNKNFAPEDHNYGADLVPEVGDIILYQEGYYEVDNIVANQYFMGKNPDYPNQPGNWNPDLQDFGSNISVICEAHYVPADKVGITQERYI